MFYSENAMPVQGAMWCGAVQCNAQLYIPSPKNINNIGAKAQLKK